MEQIETYFFLLNESLRKVDKRPQEGWGGGVDGAHCPVPSPYHLVLPLYL